VRKPVIASEEMVERPIRTALSTRCAGYLRDLHAIIPLWKSGWALQGQSAKARTGTKPGPHKRGGRLRRARVTVAKARSVSSRFLDQQVSRLKQELELDDGFHRTPLVPGCL
jgi:hypothetical protein